MMRLFGICWLVAGAALTVPAQTNPPPIRKLSLEDCIEVALQHNFDVQIKRFNPQIMRYNLGAAYGSYDPTFSISGERDFSQMPGGYDAQGLRYPGMQTDVNQGSAGFGGLLPWGLSYSLGGSVGDTWGTQPAQVQTPDFSRPFYVTNTFLDLNQNQNVSFRTTNYVFKTVDVSVPFENAYGRAGLLSLRQPLLKNAWIDNARLQIILNKSNLKNSELDVRNQVMNTIFAVEQAYYNLIFAEENVKVQQMALELAQRTLAENKERVAIGALAPLDEKQAESQVASSRASLLSALGDRDTQQRRLKNLLSDNYAKWKDASLQAAETLVAVPERFDLQESWRKGLTLRPDLQQQLLSLERQGYLVRYQKNQMFPQLDLVGTYGYNASSSDFTSTLDQFRGRDNPFWSVGAQVTIPLGNIGARNNYRAARATGQQITLQLNQLRQNILITIENDIAVAQTAFLRVDATREARLYAAAALDAEGKKLLSGKSTSFQVLQLQKNLTDARSAEIRALADYNIALAQLALDEGSTLERRYVKLDVK
ncbi:MAG: TolC family protein [Verrucomicrobiota bacterium]